MTPAQEDHLRDAWHGPLAMDLIAKRFGLSRDGVKKFWKREKAAGRLPDEPRPCFAAVTPPRAEIPSAVAAAAPDADADADLALDREMATSELQGQSMEESARAATEALLAALNAAHADYDPARQTVEPGVLALEDGKRIFTPSLQWLRGRARRVDQLARERCPV